MLERAYDTFETRRKQTNLSTKKKPHVHSNFVPHSLTYTDYLNNKIIVVTLILCGIFR